MLNTQNPIARKEKLVVQETAEEVLVYDLETNKAHCLNQTAAFVWKNCDGKNSVTDLANNFKLESGHNVPEDLIWLAIDQLNERNLLTKTAPAKFAGQNRRDVLKKIGMASIVALPLIASLTAPTAALAVACSAGTRNCTGCNNGNTCTTGGGAAGTCQGGTCV